MGSVAQSYVSFFGKTSCVSSVPGRHHAVEEVDAGRDGVEDVLRAADAHQVARSVGRQEVRRHLERLADRLGPFADADAADRVAVEILGDEGFRAFCAEVRMRAPLNDPEKGLIGAPVGRLAARRPRRSSDRRRRRSPPSMAGKRGQWSRHIATSAPSFSWIAMARSGVSSRMLPSR